MPQKLLQKRRNKHLQQTPPENLIPNRPVGRKETRRGTSISFIHMEEELRNKWVFSWNVLKGGPQTQAPALESTIQEENSFVHRITLNPGEVKFPGKFELQVLLHRGGSSTFSGKFVVEPFAHKLNYQMSRTVGGNIIQILNQNASKELRTKLAIETRLYSDLNKNPLVSAALPESPNKGVPTKELREKMVKMCTSIYWDKKEPSVADFLNQQMRRHLYCSLYTLHEMGIKRGRMKDLHKNQYTECRKIGLLYGNLPKRTLVRQMRRAKGGGGNLDCKFLSALERRLDVVLKRILFFPTIKSARQWINRGDILVNNCTCTTPGYLLQPADLIHIRKRAQIAWKVGWFKHFGKIGDLRISHLVDYSSNCVIVPGKGLPSAKRNQVHAGRRFLLSPSALQKWKEWGVLWGNWNNITRSTGVKKNLQLHRWAESSYQWAQCTHHLFQNSALASYFKKTQVIHRRRTAMTSWLSKIRAYLLSRKGSRGISLPSSRVGPRPFSTGNWRENGKRILRREPSRTSLFLRKVLDATLLHQQQAPVTDGLYVLRWSKVFTKIKTFIQKRKDWRYSCIKPMYVECSYKHGSAIFLYTPQKLAWPSSINVFLLRKAFS